MPLPGGGREIDPKDDRLGRRGIDSLPERLREADDSKPQIAQLLASLTLRRRLAVELWHGLRGGSCGRFANHAAAMKVKACAARTIYREAMAELWILANGVHAGKSGGVSQVWIPAAPEEQSGSDGA